MKKNTLKKLIRKTKDSPLWKQLVLAHEENIAIIDTKEQVLFGNPSPIDTKTYSIIVNHQILGYVKGNTEAQTIALFLADQGQKEDDKKQIANEVLSLYREINVIYNFSDKLAETIQPVDIADLVLVEAANLINAPQGTVVLIAEQTGQAEILAQIGDIFLTTEILESPNSFWQSIIQNQQSEIQNYLPPSTGLQTMLHAPLKVKHRLMGVIILGHPETIEYTAADLKLLTTLALQASSAIESASLYEKRIRETEERAKAMQEIHEVTTRFVPFEFIKSLGKTKLTDLRLGDQVEREVTVLFLDIRDFTSMAEQMTPAQNFNFVNAFNRRLGPLIREHHGFINQYLGDGIMAIFPNNAVDALSAAVAIQKILMDYNIKRQFKNRRPIKVGIGMHTGSLIMGITGDEQRMDAATISDTVNTASRIENLSKHYGVSVLLSEASLQQIGVAKNRFQFRYLGKVQVKGKQQPINIYECFSGESTADCQQKIALRSPFEEGMVHYFEKSFLQAAVAFQNALNIYPKDMPAQLFLKKANRYKKEGVVSEWTGVEKMEQK